MRCVVIDIFFFPQVVVETHTAAETCVGWSPPKIPNGGKGIELTTAAFDRRRTGNHILARDNTARCIFGGLPSQHNCVASLTRHAT